MSEQKKDERWLVAELRRVINTTKPEFDAEAWKQRYAKEYETLEARGRSAVRVRIGAGRRVRLLGGGLAMAATILIAVAILFMQKPSREASGPAAGGSASESSPAKMVSMMSLSTAFRRGGMEALDRQFETAIEKLGPRPNGLSMAELYGDLEG
jgi:hypothetical protein